MSFINKSVNYAQTVLLKTRLLSPILETYNKTIRDRFDDIELCLSYHIIPNNNQKYYLFITKKANIETCRENYDLLYFFPDEQTKQFAHKSKVKAHMTSDFFMEINSTFEENILFEGYMYKKDEKNTYLITDILYKNDRVVDVDYNLRHCLVNELTMKLQLKHLNDHLTIGIHPNFISDNENMVSIFMNNFIFQEDICAIENIQKHNKINKVRNDIINKANKQKRIEKGPYIDVYNVFDLETGENNGILYIKGLEESKQMKELIKHSQYITLNCSFNTNFNKWQPCF
jgi:hypothetical protein